MVMDVVQLGSPLSLNRALFCPLMRLAMANIHRAKFIQQRPDPMRPTTELSASLHMVGRFHVWLNGVSF